MTGGTVGRAGAGTIIHNGAGGNDTFDIAGGRLNSSIERDNGGTNTLNIGTALSNAVVTGNIALTGASNNTFFIDGTNNGDGTQMDIDITSGNANGAVLDFTLKNGRVGAAVAAANTLASAGGGNDKFTVSGGALNSNIVKTNGGNMTFTMTGGTVGVSGVSTVTNTNGGNDTYTI